MCVKNKIIKIEKAREIEIGGLNWVKFLLEWIMLFRGLYEKSSICGGEGKEGKGCGRKGLIKW